MNRIKELRKKKKLSQVELAALVGVHQTAVSQWENEKTEPGGEVLFKLAELFGVSVGYVLGYENSDREFRMKLDLFNEDKQTISTWIPVLGRIPAGTPIEAIEEVVDREDIPSALARKGEHFGLRIVGDSMSPVYLDGDTIIVRKQSDCESGEDCVVMINGDDATFKRVIKNENGILLRPLNPDYDVMMFSNEDIEKLPVRIVGIAVEVRRKIGK